MEKIESNYPRGNPPDDSGGRGPDFSVYAYLLVISFLISSPGSVVFTPIQFIYKDQLHMTAAQTATFKLFVNVPGILAFVFGIARDRYNPLRMGDRGFLLIFGFLSAVILFLISAAPLTITTLGVGLILFSIATGMIGAAFQAIMRNIAEARRMTGRMSTLYNSVLSGIGALALFCGGWLTQHLSWRMQLDVVALLYVAIGLSAFWKPKGVLTEANDRTGASFQQLGNEFKLLLKYRAYWLAAAIWGLWSFAPASGTPMQYYVTDTLKMTPEEYGNYLSVLTIAFLPTTLIFGVLCKRFKLRSLLLFSTMIAVPQWLPVIFVHNAMGVYASGIFVGLTGGLATVAYYGLLFRACPEKLAGTGMLIGSGLAVAALEVGNVAGGYIYKAGGFVVCGVITTLAYAVLLPLCLFVPKALIEPKEDEKVPSELELIAAS